jgi:iron-sulfur cluster assembly protein
MVLKDILLVHRDYELYLLGTTLDWKEDTFKAEFTITNPNSKSSCGCGESFSI